MRKLFSSTGYYVMLFFQLSCPAHANHHFSQQGDISKMNLDLEDFHDDCTDLLNEPMKEKQTIDSEKMTKVKKIM